MNIRWTTSALADIDNILAYATDRNSLEAHNIRLRVERAEKNILTFPKAAFYNQEKDYYERYVPNTRIILIYQIIDPDVVIIAAFHTSQSQHSNPYR